MAKRTKSGDPAKCVVLIRCSKEEQRLGPEAQRDAINQWARRAGVQIVATFVEDGVRGGTPIPKREKLLLAIAALKEHGAGSLVVLKRDRLARGVDLARMIETLVRDAGAVIVSAAGEGNGDTPADRVMRTVIDGFAEYERELISVRTAAALAVLRAKGQRVGGIPYGWRVIEGSKQLEKDETEQAVISTVLGMRKQGLSTHGIARELNERGIRTRKGDWHQTQVVKVLKKAS